MNKLNVQSVSIIQRVITIKKAMNEIQKCTASQQVNDALNIWNRPSIVAVLGLPINLSILVYRKGNIGQSGE